MRKTMRKIGMMTIFFCLIAMMAAGCKKEEKEEVKKEKGKTYEFFYDKDVYKRQRQTGSKY